MHPFIGAEGWRPTVMDGAQGTVGAVLRATAVGSLLMALSRGGQPRLATSWWRGR
jgi:hypothetical protein